MWLWLGMQDSKRTWIDPNFRVGGLGCSWEQKEFISWRFQTLTLWMAALLMVDSIDMLASTAETWRVSDWHLRKQVCCSHIIIIRIWSGTKFVEDTIIVELKRQCSCIAVFITYWVFIIWVRHSQISEQNIFTHSPSRLYSLQESHTSEVLCHPYSLEIPMAMGWSSSRSTRRNSRKISRFHVNMCHSMWTHHCDHWREILPGIVHITYQDIRICSNTLHS